MRFLFVGDVVGKPGRKATSYFIPKLRKQHQLDAVVVNAENAAGGVGLTPTIARGFFSEGADVLTGGNHIWRYPEILPYLDEEPRLLRPANYPSHGHTPTPGTGSYKLRLDGGKRTLGVIHVEGRVFMRPLDCPLAAIERELEVLGDCTAILIDVHAEASSEKQAIGWAFDGRVSAVIGTHTHVPTADERILPRGTAFQTDTGMTGPYESVIGMRAEGSVERLHTWRHVPYTVANGDIRLCGLIVEVDDATGKAIGVERIQERLEG